MVGKLKRKGLIELRSTREVIVPDIEALAAVANIDYWVTENGRQAGEPQA